MPDSSLDALATQLANRKLSTRDQRLYGRILGGVEAPGREAADNATDLSQGNLQELAQQIQATRDPTIRQILTAELARLGKLAQSQPGLPPIAGMQGFSSGVYKPGEPENEKLIHGGYPTPLLPYMDEASKKLPINPIMWPNPRPDRPPTPAPTYGGIRG